MNAPTETLAILQGAIIAETIASEGGFVDHISDPGGATNYGVSLRWLRSTGQVDADGDGVLDGDLDGDGDVDQDDIKVLTKDKAAEFYADKFWSKHYWGVLPDGVESVAKVFDLAVNCGPRQAHKFLQRALNTECAAALTVDGRIGRMTETAWANAIEQYGDRDVLVAVRDQARLFYHTLAERKPALEVFLRGWIVRLDRESNAGLHA